MNKLLAVLLAGLFAVSVQAFAADNAKPQADAKPAVTAKKGHHMAKKAGKKADDKASEAAPK